MVSEGRSQGNVNVGLQRRCGGRVVSEGRSQGNVDVGLQIRGAVAAEWCQKEDHKEMLM